MDNKVLVLENITKTFPGVKALDNVTFDLYEGEVHIFLGENGAGKSTLMKVLAGAYRADSGRIIIDGKEVSITNPRQAQEMRIAMIYQEFNLVPHLTVAQNIFLGREPRTKSGAIDKRKMVEESAKLLDFLGVEISPSAWVSQLGVAKLQLVEVAKALSVDAKVLVMDEPTATLSEVEIEQLFRAIRNLKDEGVSIIYISHRLQEIKHIGDRVTVIRDGKTVGTRMINEVTLDELISMMVGREVTNTRIRSENFSQDEECLRLVNVSQKEKLRNINMYVNKGEIVGLAGLVGSGRTELANIIFGIDKMTDGEIYLFGKPQKKKNTPALSIYNKMGFIPENRKEDGLATEMNIMSNVVQASLKKLFPKLVMNNRKEESVSKKLCADMKLNTDVMTRLVKNLSGGNQQKVVLAKWLCTNSDFMIFDEPTRGIDVGAKEEIHTLMHRLTESGIGILMISSELPEILSMSDRIYVMREGEIVTELPGEGITQEEIIGYAAGRREQNEQTQ